MKRKFQASACVGGDASAKGNRSNFCAANGGRMSTTEFELDPGFSAIPMKPAENQVATLSAAGEEGHYVVRGTIPEEKISELEAQPNVVKVWRNAHDSPFR